MVEINDGLRLSIKRDPVPQVRVRVGDELRWAVSFHVLLPRESGGEAIISSGVPPDVCASCGRRSEGR